ncbi:hypothetical protein KY284_035704 [Solanum tuberosum]|nr:hypothetical protein KY284_035704 [Solanum tuberosum]
MIDDDVRLDDDWMPKDEGLGVREEKEAHSRAVILESVGDIPDAEMKCALYHKTGDSHCYAFIELEDKESSSKLLKKRLQEHGAHPCCQSQHRDGAQHSLNSLESEMVGLKQNILLLQDKVKFKEARVTELEAILGSSSKEEAIENAEIDVDVDVDVDVGLEDDWGSMDERDLPYAEIKPRDNNVLWVCNLNSVTEDEDLYTIFSRFGTVASSEIIRDRETGDSHCYGFMSSRTKRPSECRKVMEPILNKTASSMAEMVRLIDIR